MHISADYSHSSAQSSPKKSEKRKDSELWEIWQVFESNKYMLIPE